MSKDARNIINLYRKHAKTWASLRGDTLREQKWIDIFTSHLPENPTVLDIGCGTGSPIGRHLIKLNTRLTGIDAAPEMIEIANETLPNATWHTGDMRGFDLGQTFDGILAWNSAFHLTPNDQMQMFSVYQAHATKGTMLMFTSGTSHGTAMGEFQGEPLYHASLSPQEFRNGLGQHGFSVVDHIAEDPECNGQTVWLARYEEE